MSDSSSHSNAPVSAKTEPAQAKPPALKERRYGRVYSRIDLPALLPLAAAGALAGAGTYAAVLTEPPSEYRGYLFLGSLVAAVFWLYRVVTTNNDVLVGDAGVAIEKAGEVQRLLWSEIQSIRYENQHLVLLGAHTTLRIPELFHTQAIRSILKEAAERLPKIIDVPAKLVDELPTLVAAKPPQPQAVHALQIAGKRCVVSKQVITVERDARLCRNCMTVYHRTKVPTICVTCDRELAGNTLTL
jgi:hypothetical protein